VLVFGLCGVAGLAWATFFVMLFGTGVLGVWLVARGRGAAARDLALHPST
jgi:Na+-driven multidrug efflux pump